MAFGESLAAFIGDERGVMPGRFRQPEGTAYQYLSRRGLEQIGPADDLGDRHGRIVDSDRELIGRYSVLAPNEEVTEIVAGDKPLWPKVAVVELDGIAVWNPEAPVDADLCGSLDITGARWA